MEPVDGEDPSLWSPKFEQMFVQMLVELVNTGRLVNGVVHLNLWSPIASQLSSLTDWTYTAI